MRLTIAILGVEVFDISIGRDVADCYETEVEPDAAGDVTSYPIGFTRPEIPWDADGPVHQFDPSEESEDV
ncbi:MAG: hypothetical protein JWP74_1748 [Marmoricola sp.]|nr:hypothetical protein [Marmoricola sp.]